MAEVAICSLVRDGMAYLPAYRSQLENLRLEEGDTWHLYILEGDSRDGSQTFLQAWAAEDPRITIGQEHVGDASEKEDRAGRWARVGNACFDLVPPTALHTHYLWLEADLCFPTELLARLLDRHVDIVAPMIFLGGSFYDTWGFRDASGRKWKNKAPYHPQYRPHALLEMGSVGSCVLFRRAVLEAGIRFKGTYENGLLVGMCQDARAKGFKVWADTATAILHPMEPWEAQMWQPRQICLVDPQDRTIELALPEAKELGLKPNLPLLDGGALLHAQRHFWRQLFRRWSTNRLDVQVWARTYPRKSYDLVIRVQPPSGLFRLAPVRGALLQCQRLSKLRYSPERGGSWTSGLFQCSIAISMEEAP